MNPAHQTELGGSSPLSATERQKILLAWNNTQADYPRNTTLHEIVSAQARRTPERIAVSFEREHLTYEELERRSNQLAHALQARGVGLETLVGLYVQRSLEMVVGMLGILKAGGAFIPIDPDLPLARIKLMLDDARAPLLVTEEALLTGPDGALPPRICLDSDWPQIMRQPGTPPVTAAGPENLVYVIYTSGSTGTPKGVQIIHRSLLNLLNSMRRRPGFAEQDHLLAVTTIAFDPTLYELFLPLTTGARVTIASREVTVDGVRLQQLIDEAGITFMRGTPTNWRLLLESGWQGKQDLTIISGGEALTLELARELLRRSAAVWNQYGPTETTVTCTSSRIMPDTELIAIGRPIDNTQAYILDERLQPLPVGVTGRLYIAGDGLARGYLNRPDLTAERFLPNPFSENGAGPTPRMYWTGDLARFLPDGQIQYMGRDDFQVKIRGYRIELGDIEAAVNRHPAVAHNVTVAREDTPGDLRLVTYLTVEPGRKPPDGRELRAFLSRTLPEYMLPARFVLLEKFPVLPSGKLDRRALPAPDRVASEFDAGFVAPRSELEEEVSAMVAGVLGLDRVSIEDDFFELGGNSLSATRLLYLIQEQFQARISLRGFLEQPTVAGLSAAIAAAIETDLVGLPLAEAPLVAPSVDGAGHDLLARSNLTRGQFLMWMGQQINPDVPLYNVIHCYVIQGELDVRAFRAAFQALVDQHDTLRTIVREVNGVPQQQVLAGFTAGVDLLDFSAGANPQPAYEDWLAARKMRILVMDEQLYDAALVKLAADRFVWYFNQHHMMTDAVSAELLFERLAHAYQLALDGRLDSIPAPPQYADHVHYERALRETAAYRQALSYWQVRYGAPLPPTEFYGKVATGASLHTERVVCELGAGRSDALRAIARLGIFASPTEDMALFTIFATLLFTALHRISGRHTLRLGTPYHGRPTAEALDIAGLFIEMGVLQVEIDEGETFVTLGEKVMAEMLDGLSNILPGVSSADTNRAYDVVLNFIQATFPAFAGLPVRRDLAHANHIDAGHTLRLQVVDFDASGNFSLVFDLKTGVFGQTERGWFVEQFLAVVDAFIADHRRGLGDFSLLNAAQHGQLLVAFNDTDAPYPADKTVVQLFEEQVARTPLAVAAVQGQETITYAALNERANRLARHLRERGVGPEITVAICMTRSIDVLVAIWGVLKAGGAYVPLDPAYPIERITYMIADAGPALALTNDDQLLAGLQTPNGMAVANLSALELSAYSAVNLDAVAGLDDLVYMIYTSGSTGRPKGAMLTHRGLLNYAWWARRTYQPDEVLDFPLYSSLAFDLTVTSIFVPLLTGGKVVVYSESDLGPGLEILTVFREDRVDIVKLTPAHLGLVRELQLRGSRIRKLIVGGEDFKTELARDIHDLFDGQIAMYNEYGPTEAAVGCMIHRYDPLSDTAVSVPIGTPAANTRIYLLDRYDQPVPPGVVGEMVISSDGVARGYHERPELTAERFAEDPFRPGARIYRSGDLARWNAQGRLVFLGRGDHQVKISGARIELGEIESRLLAHPAVQDVVVDVVQFERHLDESEVTFCLRCGLPSNYPEVTFNEAGVCNLCTDFDTFRDDVFRYFKGMDELRAIVKKARAERSGEYDCMMLYSGGKDSTYVLAQLVEMGLKVLAFSLDNGYISDEAKENIRQVTSHLGVDLVFATTPHMNAIFADSLERFSNVCQGCYKTIYTLSMNLARKKGIRYIFTGLSRGQLFETRLDELFRHRMFEVAQMDTAVLEARKVYHRVDDAVNRLLDVSLFSDDRVFGEIQFVDYFRYTDVELDELYAYLSTRVPWIRPHDTGRSTNCLINEAGIYVHTTERGYHNYALPYSWDVRLGHKTREEALDELDDDLRLPMVQQMLNEVGYTVKHWRNDQTDRRLAAYYVSADESLSVASLRAYLADTLPAYMIPSYFVRLEALPLTPNGKVNRRGLPNPAEKRPEMDAAYVAPRSELESALADIWSQTLNVARVGVHDNFFDLGGASIPAVQVVARISDQFAVAFPVSSFFEHPTVAEQSTILEDLLVAQLEALTDEEVTALLAEMGE